MALLSQRALFAQWLVSETQLLAVAAQQLVSGDEPLVVIRELVHHGLLHGPVRDGVAVVLFPEAEAQEHAQAIRLQGQDRIAPSEEQNFFGTRLADAGEFLKRPFGLGRRPSEHWTQIAIELIEDDPRSAGAFPQTSRRGFRDL